MKVLSVTTVFGFVGFFLIVFSSYGIYSTFVDMEMIFTYIKHYYKIMLLLGLYASMICVSKHRYIVQKIMLNFDPNFWTCRIKVFIMYTW